MIKKTGIVLLLVLAAQCVGRPHRAVPTDLSSIAFADTMTNDGQPCPPECVTDTMVWETYYPSPYGLYEELRGDKIIVGDTAGSVIGQRESTLPPPGTLTFNPLLDEPTSLDGTLYEGSLYYKKSIGATPGKLRYYDGSIWNDLGGGGGATDIKNCDFIGTDTNGNLICSRSSLYGKVHDTSQCTGSGGDRKSTRLN